jgi:hypothetical protein
MGIPPARLAAVAIALTLAAAPPAHAAPPLAIQHGATSADGMLGDRFTWTDASGQPRSAVLVYNDGQTGPGGSRGGELREFRYETPGGTRIVRASPMSGASGFGYVVSHPVDDTLAACLGGFDSSMLSHFVPGSFARVLEGRHHAIFRFIQMYPRFCTTAGPPAGPILVPVAVDWVFSTGRDHPLWAVTYDLSGVAANTLQDDSRAPYGELLFDGSASEAAHSVIAGVGWGDRFKFVSTDNPVTYNGNWTWDTPNTIPYVKLWTTDVDATMGTVLTQTIVQQDAGGYFGTDRWGTTSLDGNACTLGGENHLMPCSFNWPYQSINYSFGAAIGGSDDDTTNNTRLAWGANFGFLGQSSYLIHGSAFYGGPLPDTTAPGYPMKSYSTFVVLGLHSAGPVEAQVAQVEAVQGTTLTATTGTVLASGPAGVGRSDTVAYQPAGWNHVYAAWAVQAAGNAVDANFGVGAGALANPLVIVSSWTAGGMVTVRLNGTMLTQDVDFFPSARPDAQELWITLNRTLAGATNRLEIVPWTAADLVSVAVNQAAFTTGDTLVASVTANNPGLPATTDFYLGLLLPGGDTVVFFTAGGGFVLGRASSPASFQPVASGVSLAAPFAVSVPAFIYRVGWYGGQGGRLVLHAGPLNGVSQAACPQDPTTGLLACRWDPGYVATVPDSWTSGVYLSRLTNAQGYQNYVIFVVRDDRPAAFLYQQGVTTYQAYNNYPNDGATGKSLYPYNSAGAETVTGDSRAVAVSFDRPYADDGGGQFRYWEIDFVRWIERQGYDVTYSTDLDTHAHGDRLLRHSAFLSVGHDEYWSRPMFDAVEAARDAGVNLGFFGANTAYWQVRLEPSATGVPDRTMVCYKNASLDPLTGPTATVRWREWPLNRPEQTLVGVQYTAQVDWSELADYVAINSGHPLYAGTGVQDGDRIPGIVGYEVDRFMSEYAGPPALTQTLLSDSPVVDVYGRADHANTSIYQAQSGAWVFAAGTISWAWALDDLASDVADRRIQQLTRNVLELFLGAR